MNMELGGWVGVFYSVSLWSMRLAYINMLWIFFTLSGLIVFGIGPATGAMFTVIRKWVMRETDIPVFKTFWDQYRKDFIKTNLLTMIMLLIGYILYIDLKFFNSMDGFLFQILSYLFIGLFLLFFITLMHLFPIFVHCELKVLQYIKFSFLYGLSYPIITVLMIISILVMYKIVMFIPGLLPFFSIGPLSFILMWVTYRGLMRIELNGEPKDRAGNVKGNKENTII
jgi:uncharacterized membrane protein YesL